MRKTVPLVRHVRLAVMVSVLGLSCGRVDRAPLDEETEASASTPNLFDGNYDTAACGEAAAKRSSVGCSYWPVHMDGSNGAQNGCFVTFVANTADSPTFIEATFAGEPIDLGSFAKIPEGAGADLKYQPYDSARGLAPGKVAILFLAGPPEAGETDAHTTNTRYKTPVKCPVVPALSALTQVRGTGIGHAFHVRTSQPVVAYQMLPYGGGYAAVTGATLLIPESAWGTEYVAVDAYTAGDLGGNGETSMDIVAAENGTEVTMSPKVAIMGGATVKKAAENEPVTYTLQRGEVLQITQTLELTGSPVRSNKPIAMYAGMPCMNVPANLGYCDHGEQQIPHIRALGHEYVAALYRQRARVAENVPWRVIGVVDGTTLSSDPPGIGPSKIAAGQVVEFTSSRSFSIASQDEKHPFLLVGYMTGATAVEDGRGDGGYGDADFVRVVPAAQYMKRYVFFTDPTYPETNLVVTRPIAGADVTLDCLGKVTGWKPVGGGFETAWIDLSRHDFEGVGNCHNGGHVMESSGAFGLTVWGWGSPETTKNTGYVSYGYPAGENLTELSDVKVNLR